MPILHKLVAVCEGSCCSAREEYEAVVNHTGEPAHDSYGSSDLTARDVEHDPDLPKTFAYVRTSFGVKLLCSHCQENPQ